MPMYAEITQRLLLALAMGAAIGAERSYHGRPAGFRTHALVCLSTALLMLITVYEGHWFAPEHGARATVDPTRMAQGIMTGIGFLGAGAILRDGFTVRGLTTAASIWITAAIGVMVGVGLYYPASLAVTLALGTLSLFRWIERKIPAQIYARLTVRFARDAVMPEADLHKLVTDYGFSAAQVSYQLSDGAFEYRMAVRTARAANVSAFANALTHLHGLREFHLAPTGD